MNATGLEALNLTPEELALLTQLLEQERNKLLIGIRHTDHRAFREELRHRLRLVEETADRCRLGVTQTG